MTLKEATSLCHSCPKLCRYACPVAETDQDEATTPWGKMSLMKLSDAGHIPFDHRTASFAYKCLDCQASKEACEMKNPVSETLFSYRAKAFHSGVAPAAVYTYTKKFSRHNNPFGVDLSQRLENLLPKEAAKKTNRVAYFPGCTEIKYFPETIKNTFKLFKRLKINVGLYKESILCCGYSLLAAGDIENFKEVAEVMAHALENYDEIISGSATCLYTMEKVYPAFGLPVSTRFIHISEKLKSSISKIPRGNSRRKVAYHDSCYLGRGRGVYQEPRDLIERVLGSPPVEFYRNREESLCSGAGGLLSLTSPTTAKKITLERLAEYQKTGATTLVTASPESLHRFKEIAPKIKVKSLVDFIAEGIHA